MAWTQASSVRCCRDFLAAASLLLATTVASALDPGRPIAEFIHDSWSADDGLPQSTVSADIVQSADGYLWIGTHEGLARFNGHGFRVYDSANTPGLSSNGIMELAIAANGDLLIGLRDGGLARMHEGSIAPVSMPAVNAGVLAIAEQADGSLWLGTRGSGLVYLPAHGDALVLSAAQGLPDDVVAALLPSPAGFLWVGTRRGLMRLDWQDGHPSLREEPGMPRVSVSDLVLDRDGRLWVASLDAGLWVQESETWRRYDLADGLANLTVPRIRVDASGAVWIGTVAGLQRLAHDQFDPPLGADEGLSSDVVRTLLVDAEGSVWVGTDSGLDRFRDGIIHALRPGRGPGEGAVRSVAVDHEDQLWIGTTNGLFSTRDGTEQRFGRADGLGSESVLSVLEDVHGVVWVATQDGGIHRRSGSGFVDLAAELQASTGGVRGIWRALRRVRGGMLLGSQFGVLLLRDDGGREFYGKAQGLLREQVLSLFEDASGKIWVGSRFGVMRMRPAPAGAATSYLVETLPEAFAFPAPVLGFAALPGDRVLMTTGRGLALADDVRVRHLGGLKRTMFNIADDGIGHWWMCSNRGLHRVNSGELQAQIDAGWDAPEQPLPVSVLDRSDGMATPQCNGGSEPSHTRLADGRLAFATTRGVAIIDPARQLASNPRPPSVSIESAEIDFQPVALPASGQALVLEPGQRRVDLSFVGLSLVDPGAVRYRYRLEGEDPDWVDAGDRRTAVLANLAPGTYRFLVTASNNSGVWSETGASLLLQVRPHWTATWWFRAAIALCVVLTVMLGLRLRLRSLARHARELSALVRQKTADLATERDRLAQAGDEKERLLQQLAMQSAQFETMARVDGLTQLANRREFDRVLATAQAERTALSLALGDVDHFKEINDQCSHVVGDEVLQALASILRLHCRPDQLAVRFGGEELALVMPRMALAEARAQVELIRQAIERHPWESLHPGLRVTISFGVADSNEADDVAQLLALADRRLYQSKANGRNQVSP